MRFYLDEDLSHQIATIAQERFGLDVWSSHAMGMDGSRDEEQLAFARTHQRALVTNNRNDFWRLSAAFIERGLSYSTILITTNMDSSDFLLVARALARYHQQYPDGDYIPFLVDFLHPPDNAQSMPGAGPSR